MSISRRRRRAIQLLTLVLFLLAVASAHWSGQRRAQRRVLHPQSFPASELGSSYDISSPRTDLADLCYNHGFDLFRSGRSGRKVYDLFLLSTELDWLEIRLHTLAAYVDYFVIVESETTFTGLPKPLYLTANWDKFASFHHKIIHRVVKDPGSIVGSRTWDHEDYMRNAMFDHVFPTLVGTSQEAVRGDVLVVSDVDEIPKPSTLSLLRHCSFPARMTLRSHFYYFSFQWLHRGEQWPHPQVTIYRGLKNTISPKDLRNGEGGNGFLFLGRLWTWWEKADLWDAAWHCSSCFATMGEMRKKMESFSHTGWNTADNRQTQSLLHRVRNGLDLFGREGEEYDRISGNSDLPEYIRENKAKFGYLLDRDGENAGFTDWHHGDP